MRKRKIVRRRTVEVAEPPTERQTYDVEEVARILGISRGIAYRMAREKTIPSLRIGRRLVIPKQAFNEWFNNPHGFFSKED